MNVDNAPANLCVSLELQRGGDTGRGKVEHRNFLQLMFIHHMHDVGQVMFSQ